MFVYLCVRTITFELDDLDADIVCFVAFCRGLILILQVLHAEMETKARQNAATHA